MKILCMVPIYGRHDVLPITFAGFERLAKQMAEQGDQLYILLITSNIEDYSICFKWSFSVNTWPQVFICHTFNEPLGVKLNTGLKAAIGYMDSYKIEWLMLSGSDNLFSDDFLSYIQSKTFLPYLNPFFGFTNVAMYHKATGEAVEMVYPCASGVGRMHHVEMLKRACDCYVAIAQKSLAGRFGSHGKGQRVYIPKHHNPDPSNYEIIGEAWHLWPDGTYNSTDIDSENWLLMSGYACEYIKTPEPVILDIKTGDNISKWEDFKGNRQNRPITDLSKYPELALPDLKALSDQSAIEADQVYKAIEQAGQLNKID